MGARRNDTIFALSSGRGPAAIAVIRVSGPMAGPMLDRMARPRPAPRLAAFRRVRDPVSGEVLDEALVLWLPGPGSETGEDVAELQIHGGAAVVAAVLGALARMEGCRLAEPGEFARRAFENGKLDLTAAEGLADLIDAETEAQRRQALAQAGGALARLYEGWRERLLEAMGLLEAAIDFADEGDVAEGAADRARAMVAALPREIRGHLGAAGRGEIRRSGYRVVLAGPPNAGKSSLLNALARRDVAIVSPEAGTTRDVLEARLDLGGYVVIVSDTAGLREAEGAIEKEGMRRTIRAAGEAHLVLWLEAADASPSLLPHDLAAHEADGQLLRVTSKIDLAADRAPGSTSLAISTVTGDGLEALTSLVRERAARSAAGPGGVEDDPVPTQVRHRIHLSEAAGHLERFLSSPLGETELRAEDLRLTAAELGRLTGRIDAEDVLDRIFSRFCIGK